MRLFQRSELGQTDDPNVLVPGDVAAVHETARSLGVYSRALDHVGNALTKIDEGGWKGQAASNFRACFDLQPKRWLDAADAFEKASTAIEAYAEVLAITKNQAAEAIYLWDKGVALTNQASIYNPVLAARSSLTGGLDFLGIDKSVPGDPGAELREAARNKLDRARFQLDDAGVHAARQVGEARDVAPPNPTLLEQLKSFFSGGEEEIAGTVGLLNPAHWGDAVTGAAQLSELAAKDGPAALKQLLDYETMRDDPAKWTGAFVTGALLGKGTGKLTKVGRLPDGLGHHIFKGDPRQGRISGYHHRHNGVDEGDFKLVEMKGEPDANGVYKAKFEGLDLDGALKKKTSTFFPDGWTPARVEDAIGQAFENRERVIDGFGNVVEHKWQGRVDGVLIEGMFSRESTASFENAKLYDIGTAYPKYKM